MSCVGIASAECIIEEPSNMVAILAFEDGKTEVLCSFLGQPKTGCPTYCEGHCPFKRGA